MLGGASDVSEDPLGGYDETGIRPRARDMNSGPEKGDNVIQVILNHTFFRINFVGMLTQMQVLPDAVHKMHV